MPVRFPTWAVPLTACLILIPTLSATGLGQVAPPVLATPAPEAAITASASASATQDSAVTEHASQVSPARAAYQAAWAQREAGDFAAAITTIDAALVQIAEALGRDPDAADRRELTEMRAKLDGLRAAARHDLDSPPQAPAEVKTADARIADAKPAAPAAVASDAPFLNAPAIESIEPQFNADVYRWIDFFTGSGRSVFERWLKRSGRYMDLFRDVLQREGLPPDLVHLVFVESGFNVNARSYSAAVGPWQFLRSTGRLFGLTVNQWVDERKDPEKSTVAAARYLKHLYSIFGDWPLALASYNAGEGAVLRAIKRQGTTNYWDLRLPQQTEQYVPQFMAVLAISRDPQKYGFDEVQLDDPMNFDEIALKGTVDLRAIARLADCSYDQIRELNPAVLRHAAPGRDGVTMLRVPKGKAQVILSKLEDGAALPPVDLTVKHRVRRGETLNAIANEYHVDATQLARDNAITRHRPLRRGMVLTVRGNMKSAHMRAAELDPGDPRASTAYVPSRKLSSRISLNAASKADGRVNVTVHRGETLASIAKRYDVTVKEIMRWNHLSSGQVRRGTRLKIRTGDPAAAAEPAIAPGDSAQIASIRTRPPRSRAHGVRAAKMPLKRIVFVRPGETLSQIALRNGTSVEKILRSNGLTSSRVRAGQKLKIPA